MSSILIIEDDITFCQLLEHFLAQHGFVVTAANTIKEGADLLQQNSYDIVLLDYRLPDGLGMEILTLLRDNNMNAAPIIMTSFHDTRTAVKTMRTGAYDYITKPVYPEELLLVVHEVLQKRSTHSADTSAAKFVEGDSEAAKKLHQYIHLVAPTDFSVIILGDSGTGKELAARSIHELSKRKKGPFVALDCGALSSELAGSELFGHVKGAFTGAVQNKNGQFEAADGGTLFLDEVGNLNYEVQVKLLRALQEREIQLIGSNQTIKVNVRLICATNENLLSAVKAGKFREDLYHRLNEFTMHMPSLQERKEDMETFVGYFIKQTNSELGKNVKRVSGQVLSLFMQYDWPGNLRELKNIVKRAVLLTNGNEITTDELPREMLLSVKREGAHPLNPDLKSLQKTSEVALITKTLQEVKYNKSKAAKLLNIDRSTLYYKMSKYKML